MKKLLVALAAVCAAGAVMAGGVSANPDAGTVIDEGFPCAVLDADGNTVITTDSKLILFQNKAVLRCSATVPRPDAVVIWNFANTGLLCNVGEFGSTENWSDKIGLGGLSQLVCTAAVDAAGGPAGGGYGIG